jgi:hypothetical protein
LRAHRIAQRKLARRTKRSRRRLKVRQALARVHHHNAALNILHLSPGPDGAFKRQVGSASGVSRALPEKPLLEQGAVCSQKPPALAGGVVTGASRSWLELELVTVLPARATRRANIREVSARI